MNALTKRQIEILETIRDKSSQRDFGIMDRAIKENLGNIDIQRACELLNDEYLMNGIEEDYTPNAYGKELEELLNSINAARLVK